MSKSDSDSNSDLQHVEYCAFSENWRRAREIIAGEDAIKAAGERYLPKLPDQEPDEYRAYIARTKFLNATSRTCEGLHGMIFRKPPTIETESSLIDEAAADAFVGDVTMQGQTLEDYTQFLTNEVLTVARGGTLVEFKDAARRSTFCFYAAECIWNWRTESINGKVVPTMILLHERIESGVTPETARSEKKDTDKIEIPEVVSTCIEQLRLLVLADVGGKREYQVALFNQEKDKKGDRFKWKEVSRTSPVRMGKTLDFIPFVFHKPKDMLPSVAKLPLEDIIGVNIHHYRISADLNHGLHYTALPTAWVTGFTNQKGAKPLKIGSTVVWVLDNPEATCGFLEFKGEGLGALEKAIADDKLDMTILGARLLEEQKKTAETEGTLKMRQSGESSILSTIAVTMSRSVTQAMRYALWWMSTAKDLAAIEDFGIELNTDFTTSRMEPDEIRAIVEAWVRGAVSKDTMLYNFQQGEIMPPGRSVEDEMDLIAEDTNELGRADDGRNKDLEAKAKIDAMKKAGKAKKSKAKA